MLAKVRFYRCFQVLISGAIMSYMELNSCAGHDLCLTGTGSRICSELLDVRHPIPSAVPNVRPGRYCLTWSDSVVQAQRARNVNIHKVYSISLHVLLLRALCNWYIAAPLPIRNTLSWHHQWVTRSAPCFELCVAHSNKVFRWRVRQVTHQTMT